MRSLIGNWTLDFAAETRVSMSVYKKGEKFIMMFLDRAHRLGKRMFVFPGITVYFIGRGLAGPFVWAPIGLLIDCLC